MKHKNLKKIIELFTEMENDFDEKIDSLDEAEIGETKYQQREEYYSDILEEIDGLLNEIQELKDIKLADY